MPAFKTMSAVKLVATLALLFGSASAAANSWSCSSNSNNFPDKNEAKSKIAEACQLHLQGDYKPGQGWQWCYTDSHGGYYSMSATNNDFQNKHTLTLDSCETWLDFMVDHCSAGGVNDPTSPWEVSVFWHPGAQPGNCNSK